MNKERASSGDSSPSLLPHDDDSDDCGHLSDRRHAKQSPHPDDWLCLQSFERTKKLVNFGETDG